MSDFSLPPLEAITDLAELFVPDTPLAPSLVAVNASLRVEKTSPDTLTAEESLSWKLGKE